ncbi:hypothetical protein F4820DRAFT_38741 [Hypoxylon rubiginosum]|uniref:Uncharacterized protein n=1 Tax=Hypoxylon rubiginosum TaxID=110542 RepID=A0ACB9YSB2_9PEZI|nr:hypothetical protein F4820DRAFT_38741 [Hypoxylon rubiginosum]
MEQSNVHDTTVEDQGERRPSISKAYLFWETVKFLGLSLMTGVNAGLFWHGRDGDWHGVLSVAVTWFFFACLLVIVYKESKGDHRESAAAAGAARAELDLERGLVVIGEKSSGGVHDEWSGGVEEEYEEEEYEEKYEEEYEEEYGEKPEYFVEESSGDFAEQPEYYVNDTVEYFVGEESQDQEYVPSHLTW